MEFEIYIKDNCFLPDNTDIKVNTKVYFKNTDSIRHTIHCKGHAYFPSLIIEAGHTADFTFDKPGRYEISEAVLGDMKCVIEAMEVDHENVPRINYFPTSKDKKKFQAEQELLKKKTRELAALLESTPTSPADFKELLPSSRDTEGKDFEVRSNQIYSTDSDSSNEDVNISQQRRRVKASTSKYSEINISRSTKTIMFPSVTSLIPNNITSTSTSSSSNSTNSNTKKVNTAHKKLSSPARNQSTKSMLQSSAPFNSSTVRTMPACQIAIEDFEFSMSEAEVVVGQAIEFRLAENVPGHAEHELFGVSSEKVLCFESPLLQQEECVKYTFVPTCPGEIVVSCKIFSDMSCTITVLHPSTAVRYSDNNPTNASPTATGNMAVEDADVEQPPMPWRAGVTPPSATPTTTPSKSSHPPPNTASPSEAYQDVAKRVMHLDPIVRSPARGGETGDLSESQSSFYDSDDIFSDCDVPLASRNLSLLFNSSSGAQQSASKLSTAKLFAKSQCDYGTMQNGKTAISSVPTNAASSARVTHVVTVEDYSFRPSTIVVRAGECVRFRQCAGLSIASLICEGEFTSSLVNQPCNSRLEGWEDQYNCFDHVFKVVGKFDVQNEIYVFSRCNVVVVPNSTFSESSSAIHNSFSTSTRKAGPPKLMGSFNPAAPLVPVFNKPAGSSAQRTPQRVAGLTATTSTTVNASTTSIVSTSAVCTDTVSVHTGTRSSKASTAASSDSSQRHAPLYGSFLHSNTAATSPVHHIDASTEQYINNFISSTNQIHTQNATQASVTAEGDHASQADNEISAVAAKKKAEKNRKKKQKTKEKQRAKRNALANAEQEGEGEESDGDPDERIPLLSKHSHDENELSPSVVVVGKPLVAAQRSKCFLQAQADWQEDFSEEDYDNHSGPMDVCNDEPVHLSSEVSPLVSVKSAVRGKPTDYGTVDLAVESVQEELQPIQERETTRLVSNDGNIATVPDRSKLNPVLVGTNSTDADAAQPIAEEILTTTAPGKKKKKKRSKTAVKTVGEGEQTLHADGASETAVVSVTSHVSTPPTSPNSSRGVAPSAFSSATVGNHRPVLPTPLNTALHTPVEQVQRSSERTAPAPVMSEEPHAGDSESTILAIERATNSASTSDIPVAADPLHPIAEETTSSTAPGKKKKKKRSKTAIKTVEENQQTLLADGASETATTTLVSSIEELPPPPLSVEKGLGQSILPAAVPAEAVVSTPPSSPRSSRDIVLSIAPDGNHRPSPPAPPLTVLQTPVKLRSTDEQLDASFQTPPSSITSKQEESTSERNSNLLRSALRITPIAAAKTPAALSAPSSPENSRIESSVPLEEDGSVQLSLLLAYEQQIEEFFLSRYEVIESLRIQGKQDRLPSGKEVDILFLEDMRLKPVHKSKQRGNAHIAAREKAAGKSAATSVSAGRPPLPLPAGGQPNKRK